MVNFVCPLCDYEDELSETIKAHICQDHLNWYPYECLACHTRCPTKKQIKVHCYDTHSIRDPTVTYTFDEEKGEMLKKLMRLTRINSETRLGKESQEDYVPIPSSNSGPSATVIISASPLDSSNLARMKSESNDELLTYEGSMPDIKNEGTFLSVLEEKQEIGESFDQQLAEFDNIAGGIDFVKVASIYSKMTEASSSTGSKIIGKQKQKQNSCVRMMNRYQCRKCQAVIASSSRKIHGYKHLFKDLNIALFSCSMPGCDYSHYRDSAVRLHIMVTHKNDPSLQILNAITPQITQKAKEITSECFDGVPEYTEGDVERYPEYRRKNRDKKQQYCLVCRKEITIDMNRKNDFMKHVAMHMIKICSMGWFACSICNYQAATSSRIRQHCSQKHGQEGDYVNNLENWSMENVRYVSELCFGDVNFVIEHLPWQSKKFYWEAAQAKKQADEAEKVITNEAEK